jgi:hypothetical protein
MHRISLTIIEPIVHMRHMRWWHTAVDGDGVDVDVSVIFGRANNESSANRSGA